MHRIILFMKDDISVVPIPILAPRRPRSHLPRPHHADAQPLRHHEARPARRLGRQVRIGTWQHWLYIFQCCQVSICMVHTQTQ